MSARFAAVRSFNPFLWLLLVLIFLRELLASAGAVIRAVLSADPAPSPGVVAVPLRLTSPFGITLLANMVSLTPGTTALHVSDDRRTLYVHALDAADPAALRRSIAERLEAPTLRVLR
jgi:multicomponent Na+:H+ antiporter subunit E